MGETLPVIGNFISSYGFPIVACCAMFWYMNKEREAHKEEVLQLTTALNENTLKTTEALNKNTLVLERLIDKLG